MKPAERRNLGVGMLGLIACVALNVWVFRYGILAGLVGLNLTKHVGVAVLCQAIGVNKGKPSAPGRRRLVHPPHPTWAGRHSQIRDAK